MSKRHSRCSLVIARVMRRHLPLLHALLTYRNCLVVIFPWRCNLSRFSFFYPFYPLQFEDIVVRSFVSKTKRTEDIIEKNSDWQKTRRRRAAALGGSQFLKFLQRHHHFNFCSLLSAIFKAYYFCNNIRLLRNDIRAKIAEIVGAACWEYSTKSATFPEVDVSWRPRNTTRLLVLTFFF